jgi:Domain of unknown function (DUF5664)
MSILETPNKWYSLGGLNPPPVPFPPIIGKINPQEASKYDSSKLRYELTDPLAIQGLVKVLDFGAKKYAVDNWRKGFPYSRIVASLERHLAAFKAGEDIDPESGLPHIDHLGCNWMFLSFLTKTRPDLDDRWYKHNNIGLTNEQTTNTQAPAG